MNWQKAFIFGCSILAVAVVVAAYSPVQSQGRGSGFMIASSGGQFVWRVNTSTGQVSYCLRKDNSVDPGFIAKRSPICSAQTAAVQ